MTKDYIMNRLQVGNIVKTSDYYSDLQKELFNKNKGIKKALIIAIDNVNKVATLKLQNSKTQLINLVWLELI